jgi:hypothetical protein
MAVSNYLNLNNLSQTLFKKREKKTPHDAKIAFAFTLFIPLSSLTVSLLVSIWHRVING